MGGVLVHYNTMVTAFMKSIGQLGDRAILKILAKSALVTGLFFLGLFFVFKWAVDWLTDVIMAGLASIFGSNAALLPYESAADTFLAIVLGLLASWLWFRAIAAALIPIFGDDVVRAVEAKHYPHALIRAHDTSFGHGLALGLKSLGRTLGVNILMLPFYIALVFTGVGLPILLVAVNAVLIGHDFEDMMMARHGEGFGLHNDDAKLYPAGTRFMLGLVTAIILTIPLVNFLGMIIGTAMATHLAHGREVQDHVKSNAKAS
jgi:uncharacterized protein involved in cysteine biosynthesis